MKNTIMKALKFIPLVAVLFAACSKQDDIVAPAQQQQTPTPPVTNAAQYYNLPVDGAAQFTGIIDGTSAQFIDGQEGVDNVASVSYSGNNTTLSTEFTIRENGNVVGKLVIAKRYINKNSIADTANIRQFFAPQTYGFAQGNSNSGVTVTYIDNNNKVWTSAGTQNGANFEIKNNKSTFSSPCSVDTYEVKNKIDMACTLYNNGNSIQLSGSAVGKFAVAY